MNTLTTGAVVIGLLISLIIIATQLTNLYKES